MASTRGLDLNLLDLNLNLKLDLNLNLNLSNDAKKILNVQNAGGNSVEFEALSFEVLHCCLGARLLKTEMEVAYFSEGGSITDFTCEMLGDELGVSVTRAMKFMGDFEAEDANKLLRKKLEAILESNRNNQEGWTTEYLLIWVYDHEVWEMIAQAYSRMPQELTYNLTVIQIEKARRQ